MKPQTTKTFDDVLLENKSGIKSLKNNKDRQAVAQLIDDLIEIWSLKKFDNWISSK